MSARVEPALTPDEWATVQRTGWYPGHSVAGDLLGVPSDALDIAHAGMALANERFPDGDPRKITAADVDALDALLSAARAEWGADSAECRDAAPLLAKLAAILPQP